MKVDVLQRSSILRYEGSYGSLSAFLLSPSPIVADTEMSDLRATGTLTYGNDMLHLEYREEETGIRVLVEKSGDALTVKRGGALLSFRLGTTTAFTYQTAYGALPMEAYTEKMTLIEKEHMSLLTLVYTAVFGGMAQKNEMRFKITY